MKKILILFICLIVSAPVFAQTIESGITFDWISKTQMQRDENISKIKNDLFINSVIFKYPKSEFKKQYQQHFKDKDRVKNYTEISNGKKVDDEANYCAFYFGNTSMLMAYGIQYKKDMKHVYYYDAMGSLRWIDMFSDSYPQYPYQSYQYYKNGELMYVYQYNSEYDQYVFSANKTFMGRWYKDKLYNRKAKVIMTRSNY